jgi:hypothetical protein
LRAGATGAAGATGTGATGASAAGASAAGASAAGASAACRDNTSLEPSKLEPSTETAVLDLLSVLGSAAPCPVLLGAALPFAALAANPIITRVAPTSNAISKNSSSRDPFNGDRSPCDCSRGQLHRRPAAE